MSVPRVDPRPQRLPPAGTLAPPTDDEIAVWWATTDAPAWVFEALRADLDSDTLARVNALVREEDRHRAILAHGLLRRLVAACTGLAPGKVTIDRTCASCGDTDHGKPSLATPTGGPPSLQFNLAHSGSFVAVALAGANVDVGIDVEAVQGDYDWLPARRHVFTEQEWEETGVFADPVAARFGLWARKEAAAKTTGHGLAIDLTHVALDADPHADGYARGVLTAPERRYPLLVADLEIAPDLAAAVAVLAPGDEREPPQVVVTRADLGG